LLHYRKKLDVLGVEYDPKATEQELKEKLLRVTKATEGSLEGHLDEEVEEEESEKDDFVKTTEEKADSDLESIVAARVARIEKEFEEFKRKLLSSTTGNGVVSPDLVREIGRIAKGEVNSDGLYHPDYVSSDDELAEPVTFYRIGPTWNMWIDQKADVAVQLPYGMKVIKFKRAIGFTTRSGDAIRQRMISTYTTKNRRVAEFIRGRSEFGVSIFENRKEAMNSSTTGDFINLYNRHYEALMSTRFDTLTQRAAAEGIATSIGLTHHDYAVRLAELYARREAAGMA